jgi:electron transfer flavoprotein beta subunit
MKLIVCVKQISIVTGRSRVDPAANRIVPGDLVHALNPHDEAAVEEALKIREKHGGTVTTLTLGPPRAEAALRWCVAMGADKAVHIVDENPGDRGPWVVSMGLAEVIRSLEYDLVLFGRMAIDDEMGLVGAFVADLLDLPLVMAAASVALDLHERKARVQRVLERGSREVVECVLPAVVTVDRCLNRPRYPTLAGRRAGERHEILKIDSRSLGNLLPGEDEPPTLEILRVAPPKIRPRKILAPDDDSSAAGRIQWILSGGMKQKKSAPITGDPARLAEGIIDFLKERNLLR